MTVSARLAAVLVVAAIIAGCATLRETPPPSVPGGLPASKDPGEPGQTGDASWYGEPHHGRRTASGETFDMNERTAAHRTLPMGTRLLVTNLETGRTVVVRVNDRGPDVAGRIIDLSYAAARELDAVGDGVVRVRIRVLSKPPP
jgi:rare lipoprotein A